MIVVGTKLDATTDRARLEKLRDFCVTRGLEFHAISAAPAKAFHNGRAMADALDRLAPKGPWTMPPIWPNPARRALASGA